MGIRWGGKMRFVKCRNDAEKLKEIATYCGKQIDENNFRIARFVADRVSIFDFADEIHELEMRNMHFKKIMEIIKADEFANIIIE